MANPNPSPSTRFRGGASGNPKGSSRRAKFAGEVARVTNIEVMEMGAVLLRGTLGQLHAAIEDPEASVLQRWLAILIRQSFLRGDSSIFRIVIERVVGKPPQSNTSDRARLSVTGNFRRLDPMTSEERLEELERLRIDVGND